MVEVAVDASCPQSPKAQLECGASRASSSDNMGKGSACDRFRIRTTGFLAGGGQR